MEKELNIAAILKDKSEDTKLWSPIVGECTYSGISSKNGAIIATFTDKYGEERDWDFKEDGRTLSASDDADVCLFPSKSMRSWEKFAWKKGDVLTNDKEEYPVYLIFESFENDEYTSFKSRYISILGDRNRWLQFDNKTSTNLFRKVSSDAAKSYIEKVEEHYGGKLNLETLEIEKPPQFKDGDILVVNERNRMPKGIFIFDEKSQPADLSTQISISAYAFYDAGNSIVTINDGVYVDGRKLQLATDSEKRQLFDALAKERKRWNSETKTLENLSKKFKALDYILIKDIFRTWQLHQYAFDNKYSIITVGGAAYSKQCKILPYNDQTAHLLGTTDDWKGGEG